MHASLTGKIAVVALLLSAGARVDDRTVVSVIDIPVCWTLVMSLSLVVTSDAGWRDCWWCGLSRLHWRSQGCCACSDLGTAGEF